MTFSISQRFPGGWTAVAPLALRFLVWPAAAWAAAGATQTGMGMVAAFPAVGLAVALVVVTAAIASPARLYPAVVLAEVGLAGLVVAWLGNGNSPWLLLFPWLLLDHGRRPGGRLVFPAVPVAYAAAIGWAGIPAWPQLPVHGLVYLAALMYAVFPTGRDRHEPEPGNREDTEADVIRLQERVLALFGSLAEQEGPAPGSGGMRSDGARGARALARALHSLLSRGRDPGKADVTFRPFDPGELLESACEDWVACARVRGLDVQGYITFDGKVEAFGDVSRTTRVLDLMLLAACFSATSGTIRLIAGLADSGHREPVIEFVLEVAGTADEAFVEWRVRRTLEARVREFGGECWSSGVPTSSAWRVRLPIELDIRETGDSGRLPEVPIHVAGDSVLSEVMSRYAADEGATLVDDPRDARVILLARSPRDPETDIICQEIKQANPRKPLLCQGSMASSRASVMLEADGAIPVPFTHRSLAGVVNQHLAPVTFRSRRRRDSTAERPAEPEGRSPREGSVLVAEDDAISARVVTHFLEGEGCRVQRVRDGHQALAALRESRPRLVFLDMHMPGLSGVEVAEQYRRWEREQGREPVPLVALTASSTEEDRRACREAGMDDFLNKPVDREALRTMLARLSGRNTRSEGKEEEIDQDSGN